MAISWPSYCDGSHSLHQSLYLDPKPLNSGIFLHPYCDDLKQGLFVDLFGACTNALDSVNMCIAHHAAYRKEPGQIGMVPTIMQALAVAVSKGAWMEAARLQGQALWI